MSADEANSNSQTVEEPIPDAAAVAKPENESQSEALGDSEEAKVSDLELVEESKKRGAEGAIDQNDLKGVPTGTNDGDDTVQTSDDVQALDLDQSKEDAQPEDISKKEEAKQEDAPKSDDTRQGDAPKNEDDKQEDASRDARQKEHAKQEDASKKEDAKGEVPVAPSTSSPGGAPATTRGPDLAERSASFFEPLDNRVRASNHLKLRAYEARRRSAYGSKLDSSSLYWRSFRSLILYSIEETERAERIVKAHAMANHNYTAFMRCAHANYIDDTGRAITDAKQRKKLDDERDKRKSTVGDSVLDTFTPGTAAVVSVLKGEKDPDSIKQSTRVMKEKADERAGMLYHLVESQIAIADRFEENVKYLREDSIPKFTELRTNLEKQVESMQRLGDAILSELEGAEGEVRDAWEAYYSVSTKTLGAGGASGGGAARRRGASTSPKSSSNPLSAGIDAIDDCEDVWVAEMRYRMSVAFLSACWEKCSAELSKLFASMKDTECNRRLTQRELLVAFLQRQERLWLSLPSVLTPVVKDLVERPMDRTNIENDVQTTIRLKAQTIQREPSRKKWEGPGPGLTGVDMKDGDFDLSSPLTSDLMFKANVIEKRGGMMSTWKTVLAVVTADSFLHLFEMPSTARVTSGSAPEVAFHALVPPVEVPTAESIGKRKSLLATPKSVGAAVSSVAGSMTGSATTSSTSGVASQKSWFEHLVPSDSAILPNCVISFQDTKSNSAFEVTETVFTSGATKMFTKTSTRKLLLRTISREETIDWIEVMKAPK